ncbi:MAG TPA: hypothetical protein VLG36_05040 [Candidatus Chromulinivoraceae bacterium]|nr:hypothetical protein [Candidatus Chromulinivoraceae bacterium]
MIIYNVIVSFLDNFINGSCVRSPRGKFPGERTLLSTPERLYIPASACANGHDDLATLLVTNIEVDVFDATYGDGARIDMAGLFEQCSLAYDHIPGPVGCGLQDLFVEPPLELDLQGTSTDVSHFVEHYSHLSGLESRIIMTFFQNKCKHSLCMHDSGDSVRIG